MNQPDEQPKSVEERLKELGWQDVTVREKAILQRHKAEGANELHKAFEHETMGTIYCYSEQEAIAFLGQLEKSNEIKIPTVASKRLKDNFVWDSAKSAWHTEER